MCYSYLDVIGHSRTHYMPFHNRQLQKCLDSKCVMSILHPEDCGPNCQQTCAQFVEYRPLQVVYMTRVLCRHCRYRLAQLWHAMDPSQTNPDWQDPGLREALQRGYQPLKSRVHHQIRLTKGKPRYVIPLCLAYSK